MARGPEVQGAPGPVTDGIFLSCGDFTVDSARNLGVIFDKNLSFAQHISTHRWTVLTTALGPRLVEKRLIDTRWSARRDAVHALFEGYNGIKEALSKIADDYMNK